MSQSERGASVGVSERERDRDQPGSGTGAPEPARWRAALSGLLAVAVSLGASELVAGLLSEARSLVLAVGDLVIDSVPVWLERAAIEALGTADKPVLVTGIVVVSALLGAVLGIVGARRFVLAALGFVVAAAVGVVAAFGDPRGSVAAAVVVGVIGALAGIATLYLLLRAATPARRDRPAAATGGVDRRRFLLMAAGAAAVAGVTAMTGRLQSARERVSEMRSAIRLPQPAQPAPPPPPGANLSIPGLTPLYVPNDEFYRIDTALTVPQVDAATWSMQVTGRVDRPFTLTYDELMELPQIEADITLACVSNPVGGDLVGNARWQGVPLLALLERAGLQPGATQVLGRSVDGFTAGFPTVAAGEEAMVAVAMNGEPLPADHGFPARLVIPGLFGYVSATKWLSAIELTSFDEVDGYWIPRGWAKEGPVLTQSRIDVPSGSAAIPAGQQPIAGVAWAPTRGIERVEVRIDEGPWVETELAASLDIDCWRQWVYRWDATPGEHVISVRATDGNDVTQTPDIAPVVPSGATGHHTISVRVAGS